MSYDVVFMVFTVHDFIFFVSKKRITTYYANHK